MQYTALLDFNETTGRYELNLCADDLRAVYEALKAHAEADPDGLVASVVDLLDEEGIEETWTD